MAQPMMEDTHIIKMKNFNDFKLSSSYKLVKDSNRNESLFIDNKSGYWFIIQNEFIHYIEDLKYGKYCHTSVSNELWEKIFNQLLQEKIIYSNLEKPEQKINNIIIDDVRFSLVIIEVSQYCNLSCKYCFENAPNVGELMNFKTADEIIKQIKNCHSKIK